MSNSSNNERNLPPIEELLNIPFTRRNQQRLFAMNQPDSLSSHYSIPTSTVTNSNASSTTQQLPSQPEASAFLRGPTGARENYILLPQQSPALPRSPQQYRPNTSSSNWNHQSNNVDSGPTSISLPQQSYLFQPININAEIQNVSNRGSYMGGSQRSPIEGRIAYQCSQLFDSVNVRLTRARTENEGLKLQVRMLAQARQNDLNQYNTRIQLLQDENNRLREINTDKEALCNTTLETSRELRNQNTVLRENSKKFSGFVKKITASLKTSIYAFQNHFGIHVETSEENEGTSAQKDDLGEISSQKELKELNELAINLEKARKNIGTVRMTAKPNPALPPIPSLLPINVQQLSGNSTIATLPVANSNEQSDGIRLTFSNEEDRSATILQTNRDPPPAIASSSRQAAIRDLQASVLVEKHVQALNKQQQSSFSMFRQRAQDSDDSDSDGGLIIDEGGALYSSEDSNDDENVGQNDEPSAKKQKLRDAVLSTLVEHEQLEETPERSETFLNEDGSGGNMVDDGSVAEISNGNTEISELEEMEIAAAGLYDYATCSCGREVAFLRPDFSKVEDHVHFNVSDPSDVLACRFCGRTFRNKSFHRQHLRREHGLQFFTFQGRNSEGR